MKGADKVICQAAAVLLLFAFTSAPARAQIGGRGRRWRRRHDDPDGADAGDDEGQDGQAALRHDDADHEPDDGAAGWWGLAA